MEGVARFHKQLGAWLLNESVGDFRPERDPQSRVYVVGAEGLGFPAGARWLIGWREGVPVVAYVNGGQYAVATLVVGRWSLPTSEAAAAWVARMRAEIEQEAVQATDTLVDSTRTRLMRQLVVRPADQAEQFALRLLVEEGFARKDGDDFVLAVGVLDGIPVHGQGAVGLKAAEAG